jgi:hypothetical protein
MATKVDSPSFGIQVCAANMVSHIEIDLYNRITWRKAPKQFSGEAGSFSQSGG